jgi:hypothetical protein
VAMLLRNKERSRAGHLLAVIAAAVDSGEIRLAGLSEEYEGSDITGPESVPEGKALVPRMEIPGRDIGLFRPSAPVLLTAPSLLPGVETPNNWCLPPSIVLLGNAADDDQDAPTDAPLPGYRRGHACPEFVPFGTRADRADAFVPRSQSEADARPIVDGVPETATARIGFRLWEHVEAATPTGDLEGSAFGVTLGSAAPNAPCLWPRRFTWHSVEVVRTGPTHNNRTFLYMLENSTVTSGANAPSTFTVRMDYEKCVRVDSASLRSIQALEQQNKERRAELRRRAEEAERIQRAAEAKAKKAAARAELARQWREKHIRNASRLRGSAPTLGLSDADWQAMKSASNAVVTARHLGWERWIHLDQTVDAPVDESSVSLLGERVSAVWYFHPETGASAWDPPGGWPEEDAEAAEGAALEDALRAAEAVSMVEASTDPSERGALASSMSRRVVATEPLSEAVLLAGGPPSLEAADGASLSRGGSDEPWTVPDPSTLAAPAAAAACEEILLRSLMLAFRRWVAECASRGCVDPGEAFKPPVPNPAGLRETDPGDDDGSHAQRAFVSAKRVVEDSDAALDPVRRLRRRRRGRVTQTGEESDSEYDDEDIATLGSGVHPGSGGEGRAAGPWKPGEPTDRFDLSAVFLFMDRDGDGVVSARDWAVLLSGGSVSSASGAGAAIPLSSLSASDRVAGEVVRAALWPYMRSALHRLTPPALRPLMATRLPSLMNPDALEAIGQESFERSETVRNRLEAGRDGDGADTGRDAAAMLASLLSPAVRLRAFRALKRQFAVYPRLEEQDKRPQHLRYDELARWVSGASEGHDWFGVDVTAGLHSPVASWAMLAERQSLAQSAGEWVPAIDPSSGERYYSSAMTGASVWEKGMPQLQAEAAMRRSVVAQLDTELRSVEALHRDALRRARRQTNRARRRQGLHRTLLEDDAPGREDSASAPASASPPRQPAPTGTFAEQLAAALDGDDTLVRVLAAKLGLKVPTTESEPSVAASAVALPRQPATPPGALVAGGIVSGTVVPGAVDFDDDLAAPSAASFGAMGVEWRQLQPPRDARRLRARAKESHVLGPERSTGVNEANKPRMVGLVAPRDVTVSIKPFENPPVEAVFLSDLSDAAKAARLRITIDPRTGERVVAEAGETGEAVDDRRAKQEAVTLAFSHVRAGHMEELRDVLVGGVVDINLDRDDAGNSLLIVAAQNGNKRMVKELLRKGADINSKNTKGNTSLHYCFAYGFKDLGEYLVEKGADDTLTNADGVAPREGLSKTDVDAI